MEFMRNIYSVLKSKVKAPKKEMSGRKVLKGGARGKEKLKVVENVRRIFSQAIKIAKKNGIEVKYKMYN